MKQFTKILKFELLGYLKNKVFIGTTVFLMIAITVAMFIPNILSLISTKENDSSPSSVMLIHAEDTTLSALVEEYFTQAFPDYKVQTSEHSIEELKELVIAGEADCAFVMDSASSYTYYVNNLSMYDSNTEIANEVLQTVYRLNAMISNGLTPEEATDIMSIQIESNVYTLGKNQMENFFYTYIMIFALYMVILLYGQMVASNVASEKSSRAMELLITSAKPTSMMFGKVLASCIAGLSQLIAIFGTAILLFNINKSTLQSNVIFQSIFNIPLSLLIYMLIFFVLGFLIYAFLYGAIGSTASKLEDLNTTVMPVTYLFVFAFIVVMTSMSSGTLDSTLMKVCSFIPFTSPMAMFTRIAMSSVAWYEIALSILVLVASVIGVGILSAKIYRVGVLLYGTKPQITTIIKNLFAKK